MEHYTPSEIMDSLGGLVTDEQARRIAGGEYGNPKFIAGSRPNVTAGELISFLEARAGAADTEMSANITDRVYRIFNRHTRQAGGRGFAARTIVLGEEGRTVPMRLNDKLSNLMDITPFERGDTVTVKNAAITHDGTASSLPSTSISRIKPTQMVSLSDYALLRAPVSNIDMIGMLTEVGPVRHIERLGNRMPLPVSSCRMSDGKMEVEATFWGSSALATVDIAPNSWIKIEFCSIRAADAGPTISAADSSRVVANAAFMEKMKG